MQSADEVSKKFIEVIELYRQGKGMSISRLAKLSEITPGQLYRIVNGDENVPSLEFVLKIAQPLNIPIVQVFHIFTTVDRNDKNRNYHLMHLLTKEEKKASF